MKRRAPDTTLNGIDLLEEAVHVLRLAAPAAWLCYYVGVMPFLLAVLFFWSDMSRSGIAEQHLVGGAIALSALFIWMKLWQAIFALKLSAQVANEPCPKLKAGTLLRAIASQTLIHSTGLFLILIAAQILLPFAWVYGFYQNATVLSLREPSAAALVRRSWKQTLFLPMQNHTALAVLGLFSVFIFLNVSITMLTAPRLIKMLAGVETNFTLSIWSSLNTTFLAAALGVTYLCFDPLVKAVYVLRCFYGESRLTGEDLRVTLRSFRATAVSILAALLTLLATNDLPAAPAEPRPSSPPARELDRSIDEVLKRPEYTWRSPRLKPEEKIRNEKEWKMWTRFREWARSTIKSINDWLNKFFRSRSSPSRPVGGFSFSAHGLIYILIAMVLAIIGVLVWLIWRTRSRTIDAALEATPAAPLPDLANEDVSGDELPVDGWTKLALELLERGELRLAMRAFYFSSLAHLAERHLVNIAKFKSNRDYERELLRRSHALPDLTQTFSENVSVFDCVWYGSHQINAELLQRFRGNVERIRGC